MTGAAVALVLVSHSRALADGVAELAGQMAPDVALLPAGGTEDGALGTGFDRVLTAVEAALADGRSAVVLTDLGSAVLTTESVLEMLDPDDVARVRVADAPFVEGAVEAAVAAQGGADVDAVLAAARHAGTAFAAGAGEAGDATPRASTLHGTDSSPAVHPSTGPDPSSATEPATAPAMDVEATEQASADAAAPLRDLPAARPHQAGSATTARGTAVLRNRLGLHARPAAAIARTAGGFRSWITIDGADARSVLSLVGLGAMGGREVVVMASGPDARTAVNAVVAELEQGFGEA